MQKNKYYILKIFNKFNQLKNIDVIVDQRFSYIAVVVTKNLINIIVISILDYMLFL